MLIRHSKNRFFCFHKKKNLHLQIVNSEPLIQTLTVEDIISDTALKTQRWLLLGCLNIQNGKPTDVDSYTLQLLHVRVLSKHFSRSGYQT